MLQQSTGTCVGVQYVDYLLTENVLVRFRDMIYVSDNSELKKVILREFHAKPYSGHLGYHKTLNCSEEVLLLAESKEGCGRVCRQMLGFSDG